MTAKTKNASYKSAAPKRRGRPPKINSVKQDPAPVAPPEPVVHVAAPVERDSPPDAIVASVANDKDQPMSMHNPPAGGVQPPSPHNPPPAEPKISPLQQEANESLRRPTRTITTEEIVRNARENDIGRRTSDRDILATYDPQNPIPLSRITLPDSELGLTQEERQDQRDKVREAREEKNARRLAAALKA